MKKLLLGFVISIMSYGTISAQAIKLNPFALLGGRDLVSAEFAMGERNSLQVGLGYGGFKFGELRYTSYGGGLQYRFYFQEQMNGWYAAPGAGYGGGEVKVTDAFSDDETSLSFNSFGGEVRIGRQWLFDSGFLIDINAGAGYGSFKYQFSDESEEDLYKDVLSGGGVRFAGSVGIGYAFNSGGRSRGRGRGRGRRR